MWCHCHCHSPTADVASMWTDRTWPSLSSWIVPLRAPLVPLLLLLCTSAVCALPAPRGTASHAAANSRPTGQSGLPANFTMVGLVAPSILQEMRYAGHHNFVGHPIPSYEAPECILTVQAAAALQSIQQFVSALTNSSGLGGPYTLKVYDCYRPVSSVRFFTEWVGRANDTVMQAEFYPGEDKSTFLQQGYIAANSSHSRGSTVDVTLVPLPIPSQPAYHPGDALQPCTAPDRPPRFQDNSLDTGTGFDCFSPLAWVNATNITRAQSANRTVLQTIMNQFGFQSLAVEWWHFTLRNEPFPSTYFDFPVRNYSLPTAASPAALPFAPAPPSQNQLLTVELIGRRRKLQSGRSVYEVASPSDVSN